MCLLQIEVWFYNSYFSDCFPPRMEAGMVELEEEAEDYLEEEDLLMDLSRSAWLDV